MPARAAFKAVEGRCSFCGADRRGPGRLVTTEGFIFICDPCLGLCVSVLAGERSGETPASELDGEHVVTVVSEVLAKSAAGPARANNGPGDESQLFYCMFCRRSRDQVAQLISGPRVFICETCVGDAVRCVHAASSRHSAT